MDRYQKVDQKKTHIPVNENEIRITSQGLVRNYISYASSLLQERRDREIVLKAMGQAISKTVAIAEIIKKRIPRLHQGTDISSVSITDVWEPMEEGLVPLEMTRHVSMISITLSTKELNKNSPGYQAPPYVERPRTQNNYQRQQQPRQARPVYNVANEEPYGGNYQGGRGGAGGGGRGPGQGQDGGRVGRGRDGSRGGYGNYQGGGFGNYQGGGYRNNQGGGGYRNNQGGGGYRNNQGGGYRNYQGGGYGNYQGGGYGNYQGGENYHGDGYGNYQGGENYHGDGYGNYQDNGYSNSGRGGGRGGNSGYRGPGYGRGGRGRGEGGRVYGRGQGRMSSRPRDGDQQQQ